MTLTSERHTQSTAYPRSSANHPLRISAKFEQLNGYPIGHGHIDTLQPVDDYRVPGEQHIEVDFPDVAAEEIPVTIEYSPKVETQAEPVSRARSLALGARALAGKFIETVGRPRLSEQRAKHIGAASLNLLRPIGGTHKLQPGKHRRQIGKHRA